MGGREVGVERPCVSWVWVRGGFWQVTAFILQLLIELKERGLRSGL